MEEGPEPQEWVERAAEEHHHGHEHEHEQEHAGAGAKPAAPRASAITAAVLAVLAATGSLFSGHAANQAILAQTVATDKWAEFQAKSTKGHIYQVASELLKTLAPAASKADDGRAEATITKFAAEVKRYDGEKGEIKHEAEKLEAESHEELHKHHRFATGVAMLQVGIVLASVSILIRYQALYILSLVAGAVGVGFLLVGLVG